MGRTSVQQGLVLGFYTDLVGRKSGFANSHVDIFYARSLLNILHHAHQLADTSVTQFVEIAQTKLTADRIYDMFI
jgi:hypothetical protein